MPSASSSSSHPAPHKSRRRKYTREQLLKSLEILGPLSAPLPPELPPSPPASRQSSPHPLKRRRDPDADQRKPKKARLDDGADPARHRQPQPSTSTASHRHESREDGEVKEEPQQSSVSGPIATLLPFEPPMRRPRRYRISRTDFESILDKSYNAARQLFYSSHARTYAAYPPTHSSYRPLPQPPPAGSPYAQHSLLIARLELLDAVLHYAYALWWKDNFDHACYRGSWRSMDPILNAAKHKWQAESSDDREKAFFGLIHMVDAFINGRRAKYQLPLITQEYEAKIHRINAEHRAAEHRAAQQRRAQAEAASNVTPQMLPSPASSSSVSSANSTPLSHGTPNHNNSHPPSKPVEPKPQTPPENITIPVGVGFIVNGKAQHLAISAAAAAMDESQKHITLPVIARYFPGTLARMLHTSLNNGDEFEPDFQDGEGELFWPGQLITGEGIGWVTLMGMGMVREFGKEFGYQGIAGAVPRPPGALPTNTIPEPVLLNR